MDCSCHVDYNLTNEELTLPESDYAKLVAKREQEMPIEEMLNRMDYGGYCCADQELRMVKLKHILRNLPYTFSADEVPMRVRLLPEPEMLPEVPEPELLPGLNLLPEVPEPELLPGMNLHPEGWPHENPGGGRRKKKQSLVSEQRKSRK